MGEEVSVDNFDKFMKENGADLSMTDAVLNCLVDLGFNFD
jgi:hypothetical protein